MVPLWPIRRWQKRSVPNWKTKSKQNKAKNQQGQLSRSGGVERVKRGRFYATKNDTAQNGSGGSIPYFILYPGSSSGSSRNRGQQTKQTQLAELVACGILLLALAWLIIHIAPRTGKVYTFKCQRCGSSWGRLVGKIQVIFHLSSEFLVVSLFFLWAWHLFWKPYDENGHQTLGWCRFLGKLFDRDPFEYRIKYQWWLWLTINTFGTRSKSAKWRIRASDISL